MQKSVIDSFLKLKSYCEKENFCGWDPYDGLNSKIFQATPLKHWNLARLAWIQGFKRCPVNFRKLLLVPKEHNAKGIGLFLTGYCNLYKYSQKTGNNIFGTKQELEEKIHFLAELLISLQSKGYSGACWGHNCDWQGKLEFYFPKNTPTVVTTSFCATALMDAYEITKKKDYLKLALSSADFILIDLKRTPKTIGFLFSYSPLKGQNSVYNANLLSSKLLIHCYYYTNNDSYRKVAKANIEACVEAQRGDGSWVYGERPTQSWIDSFHTGYNLDGLIAYQKFTGDMCFNKNIEKGFNFYVNAFFLSDGTPKYYYNKIYPIDIQCPAQLFVTLSRLGKFSDYRAMADKVMKWTILNMQAPSGYFYYQLKKSISSKISYMRWSNAFMFYAMSYYLLSNLYLNK